MAELGQLMKRPTVFIVALDGESAAVAYMGPNQDITLHMPHVLRALEKYYVEAVRGNL